mmetsp:Transcript_89827/g.243647  ORF Transcript_89827/g.243647 Transcript_89827/m.243647 type:complete len:402 (+) Transcript_89827:54-1259(+)
MSPWMAVNRILRRRAPSYRPLRPTGRGPAFLRGAPRCGGGARRRRLPLDGHPRLPGRRLQLGQRACGHLRELRAERLQALLGDAGDHPVVLAEAHGVLLGGRDLHALLHRHLLQDVQALHLGLMGAPRRKRGARLTLRLAEVLLAVGQLGRLIDSGLCLLLLRVRLRLGNDACAVCLRLGLRLPLEREDLRLLLGDFQVRVVQHLLLLQLPIGLQLGDVLFRLGLDLRRLLYSLVLDHLRILARRHLGVVALLPQLLLPLVVVELKTVEGLLHVLHRRLRFEQRLLLKVVRHLPGEGHVLHGEVVHLHAVPLELGVHLVDDVLRVGASEVVHFLHSDLESHLPERLVLRSAQQVVELLRPDGVHKVLRPHDLKYHEHVDIHSDSILRLTALDWRVENHQLP